MPEDPEVSDALRSALAGQFLAALDMLENAMDACPDSLWGDSSQEPQFWYLVHHTLFWLDCYLSDSAGVYRPPAPFGLEEFDPAGVMPPRVYLRDELRAWLNHDREKLGISIAALTLENAGDGTGFPRPGLPRLDLLLYNLRHVQHHAAQLNLILRQRTGAAAPRWVARGEL